MLCYTRNTVQILILVLGIFFSVSRNVAFAGPKERLHELYIEAPRHLPPFWFESLRFVPANGQLRLLSYPNSNPVTFDANEWDLIPTREGVLDLVAKNKELSLTMRIYMFPSVFATHIEIKQLGRIQRSQVVETLQIKTDQDFPVVALSISRGDLGVLKGEEGKHSRLGTQLKWRNEIGDRAYRAHDRNGEEQVLDLNQNSDFDLARKSVIDVWNGSGRGADLSPFVAEIDGRPVSTRELRAHLKAEAAKVPPNRPSPDPWTSHACSAGASRTATRTR